jgi:hypothetical protein
MVFSGDRMESLKTRSSFPAWEQTMTGKQLDEIGDKFEDIEKEQFGGNGFKDAERQISAIKGSLGLAQFTAPPPPRVSGTYSEGAAL